MAFRKKSIGYTFVSQKQFFSFFDLNNENYLKGINNIQLNGKSIKIHTVNLIMLIENNGLQFCFQRFSIKSGTSLVAKAIEIR